MSVIVFVKFLIIMSKILISPLRKFDATPNELCLLNQNVFIKTTGYGITG